MKKPLEEVRIESIENVFGVCRKIFTKSDLAGLDLQGLDLLGLQFLARHRNISLL